ncbi:hypothetical protein CH63R_12319 [Colletotrichum higginsianum IMI 349063]|uniref:Uncharacterized protein n=1 Tax=Colletotrichum higginsianum (strain IMI 349063) TaxID=759273 RepID=A0A1B7XTU9_COLHI|nr:hypothetical protein CH63R_12319 [Colletotrichum higginsianum IMI 349063]OBR03192.1 hypothetical protein CH63R_12319 [Colletotrichum higginsianum IMI 349063]
MTAERGSFSHGGKYVGMLCRRSGISQGLAMVRRRETLRVSSANRALYLPVREIKSKPAFVFRGGGNSTAPLGEK